MIHFRELYTSGTWSEPFLILATGLFITASFFLYLFIIKSRSGNIKRERLRIVYSSCIDKLLFAVAFQDIPFSAVMQDEEYAAKADSRFFREVITESVINLHKNYDGLYAQKLEQFYKESGLINDSLKKLKSLKWDVRCKGITELAEMNVKDAFDTIITYSKARNKTLQITAINAGIKLGGTKGIVYLTAHPYPIDDWTQVNIIDAFKKHDLGDTKGIENLLESQNTTVIALGLKLIKELKLSQKVPYVAQLAERAPNTAIKYEAQNVLQTLTV
ncbi:MULTISPECIES: hypothetical protein [unclassified Flavobacterium]|uniref:hypothetical protein n=1 Tax=unclassified Flavobacterium TaxID=196869 RepID=UPI00095D4103|nr:MULTISPECIES: hypothetical protein [unclassified Flavobacterium]MBN9284908.1 hypothetical protein [Flavobacterium sp.]OJV72221.1 MAG: hypothetical protein BGO42_03270 [Flavobacterium sp. 40-81]